MHKTAIQIVKNGCDMKFYKSNTPQPIWRLDRVSSSVREMRFIGGRTELRMMTALKKTHENEFLAQWNAGVLTSSSVLLYHPFVHTSIQQVENGIFSTIDSAGQLNKMAVIWLETFHNQFVVSDRKRYVPMYLLYVRFLLRHSRFHDSVILFNQRSALRTDTILIIKAGCDSRTLWQTSFDGKSMSCLSCKGANIRIFHEHLPLLFPPFFFLCLWKSSSDETAKYSLVLSILLPRCVYLVSFEPLLSLSPLVSFTRVVSRLDSLSTGAIDRNCNFRRVIFVPL